jgi:tetratricopeptide (TPR) repeat protein
MTSPLRLLVATALTMATSLLVGLGQVIGSAQELSAQSMTLRVIVVTSEDAARRIAERLKAGESFAALAKAESTAPSADIGGWLGKLPLAQLRPEMRSALQGLRPGHISSVVRLPIGFAIFKVEDDEPSDATTAVGAALASSGAVKFMYDVSGFVDARVSLESLPRAPDWNMHPRSICEARTLSVAATRASVESYLSPENKTALAAQPPLDVMQLHIILGQLAAFEGRMDQAIGRFQEAYQLANAQVPPSALQLEEALGIAHLHKAGMENDLFAKPGEFCLLNGKPRRGYAKTADAEKAVEYFLRYLEKKPEELEVRWLLNIAYMALGAYPARVPSQYLIPPSALQSAEDVGHFNDVAPQAGLNTFASAGGVMVEDFRNSGRFDVATSTADKCGAMSLLGNNGNGTFTDRTAEAGLSGELGGLNAVHGDYNNDGCPDILILRGGWEETPQRKSLLRNNCDGTFTDVTVASGLGAPTTSQTAVWTDIDNDGFLDLFVGVENGPAQLFRNKRDGTFEDIAATAGVGRTAYSKGVVAADYDNDRYPDLYVSNYGGSNFLYHNNRNGTFTEFSEGARVLGTPNGFATWFFDYDNDGWPDLFVTSYAPSLDEMVRNYLGMPHNATTMKLYRNLGDGTFRDVSAAAGLNRVRMPMGANFGDIDNDGFLDMYLGTGNPSYGALAGSVLLHNKDGRSFVDVTASSGTGELHRGHGVAFANMDSDGDEDIVFEVGGMTPGDRHAIRLFENPGHGNDWIALKLVGVKSNRTAVGARIKVTVTDEKGQTRAIHRTVGFGGSFGASPLLQHVGLGKAPKTVDVEIWWPTSDTRQQFTNVPKNHWLQIEEFAKRVTPLKRDPVRLGGAGKVQQ